jgi:hypothetical protein
VYHANHAAGLLLLLQVMGMLFESLGQPVINGYLVAGAIVGPGGLQLIKELVQVGGVCQQHPRPSLLPVPTCMQPAE